MVDKLIDFVPQAIVLSGGLVEDHDVRDLLLTCAQHLDKAIDAGLQKE